MNLQRLLTIVGVARRGHGSAGARVAPDQIDSQRERIAELEQALRAVELELASTRHALAERSRFLATASHDLRQPIHAIGLFAGALKPELREPRARYLLERLERAMRGLDELFNRLLDISRLDSGSLAAESRVFTIGPLLQTLESRFVALAESRGLALRLRLPAHVNVRSDPVLLSELLMNLISNAVRHTARGGVLLGARRRGARLVIEVWDTGPGIAPMDRARIFEEFVQLANPHRDRRVGTGLGLSIARRLAHAIDAPLELQSRVGRGSVFRVSVPISKDVPTYAELRRTQARSPELDGALIMVVDEQIDILVGMQAMLSGWGCFVLMARSLAELRTQLESSQRFPDALITDHALADGTDSDAVAALLEEIVPVPVPVIVVTSATDATAAQSARGRGWAVLGKPADTLALQALLVERVRRPAA